MFGDGIDEVVSEMMQLTAKPVQHQHRWNGLAGDTAIEHMQTSCRQIDEFADWRDASLDAARGSQGEPNQAEQEDADQKNRSGKHGGLSRSKHQFSGELPIGDRHQALGPSADFGIGTNDHARLSALNGAENNGRSFRGR